MSILPLLYKYHQFYNILYYNLRVKGEKRGRVKSKKKGGGSRVEERGEC
jgi:hypothetical protein